MISRIDWKWTSLIIAVILNFGFGAMKFGEMKKEIEIQARTDTELKYELRALTEEIKATRETLCTIKGEMSKR